MGKYTVTAGQHIYDVALHLTGSIEGVVDLLICNPALSLETQLQKGDVLEYSDDFVINADVVARYRSAGIVPAGGERSVYPKLFGFPLQAELRIDPQRLSASFILSGTGTLQIDWGDNSAVETIRPGKTPQRFSHRFDNKISERRCIRLYGDFAAGLLDVSLMEDAEMRLIKPLSVDEFIWQNSAAGLCFAPLLSGVYRMDRFRRSSFLPNTVVINLYFLALKTSERRAIFLPVYIFKVFCLSYLVSGNHLAALNYMFPL